MRRTPTTTRTTHTVLILSILAILMTLMAPQRTAFAMPEITVEGIIWTDANCDGIRQAEEPRVSKLTVYLFTAGDDQQINTADDQVVEQWTTGTFSGYRFTLGITDLDYTVVVLKKDQPADLFPGPLNVGDDRSTDNDMRRDLWATNGFRMDASKTVTGIDIGLCQMALPLRSYLPAIWR